jgi:hypothetical protein
MTRHALKNCTLSLVLVWLALSSSIGRAQDHSSTRFHRPQPGKQHATPSQPDGVQLPTSPFTFTFVNYPGQLNTAYVGVNLGATASQQMMVGVYNTESPYIGFLVDFSNTDGVATESFGLLQDYPGSTTSFPLGINNSGQIVGNYTDSAGVYHGYVLFDGNFTAINVPFQGAVDTEPQAINDEGDIVGDWGVEGNQGFELIGGVYTVIQTPWSDDTFAFGMNDMGDVVGAYPANDTDYGFELSGGVYTSIQVPGSFSTAATAINNSGEIVGWYCPTSECNTQRGFILKGGVYSTIAVPEAMITIPYNLSDAGVIAGNYYDGKLGTALSYGFVAVPNK